MKLRERVGKRSDRGHACVCVLFCSAKTYRRDYNVALFENAHPLKEGLVRNRVCVCVVSLALMVTLSVVAQSHQARGTASGATQQTAPDKALMQRVWDAWSSMDPTKAAEFYDKQADDVFFDIAPLKYDGWQSYEAGAKNMIQQSFSALKFTVNDDARVQRSAVGALGTATIDANVTGKDGKTQHMTLRWTVIWAHENGRWLIIHEHVSAPLQQ
jgi:ketosteroid isomerase-like protein